LTVTGASLLMQKTITCVLLCLLIVTAFDPADKIAHMKIPLFAAVWVLTIIIYAIEKRTVAIPLSSVIYLISLSLLIPLSSICVYMVRNGSLAHYDGFQYLKAYLFLTLCIPLMGMKADVIRLLSFVLTAESIVIISVYAITSTGPFLSPSIRDLGDLYGVLALGSRQYGNATFYSVNYVTSPLLAISISYFSFKYIETKGRARLRNFLLLIVNVTGMFMSGTRNNMFVSVAGSFLVLFWYSKRRLPLAFAFAMILAAIACTNWGAIQGMLSATEGSNAVKLQHLRDYGVILSDPTTLLIGQGLGAVFHSTEYGYTSVTELTYMDMLRSYGLIIALPLMFCLIYPLGSLTRRSRRSVHYLYLGYASYLYLCIADPFLVSSSGMLVLSIILAKTFSVSQVPNRLIKLANA
jgi:hypothetical protein